jgi:hypothetical protein
MKRTRRPRSRRGAPRVGNRDDSSRRASPWTFLAGSIGWSTSNSSERPDGSSSLTCDRTSRPSSFSERAFQRTFRLSRRGAHPPFEVCGAHCSMTGSPTRTNGRRGFPRGSRIEVIGCAIEVTGPPNDPSGAPTRTSGAHTLVTDRHGSMIAPATEMLAMPPRSSARNMIGAVRKLESESLQPESSSRELR